MLRILVCLIAIPLLILLDQWTKWAAWEFLKFGPVAPMDFMTWLTTFPIEPHLFDGVRITSFFNIVTVWNQGVSFGMFAADDLKRAYTLVGMSGLMVLALAVWLARAPTRFVALALTMIISGALGNIIDRIRFGAVADFLDFHIGSWHWPAFNVADSLIVAGVAFLAIDTLFLAGKRDSKTDSAPAAPADNAADSTVTTANQAQAPQDAASSTPSRT